MPKSSLFFFQFLFYHSAKFIPAYIFYVFKSSGNNYCGKHFFMSFAHFLIA